MTEFDAELYLRVAGEGTLLDRGERQRPPWSSRLGSAAQALVAVGAIDEQTAADVLDDYSLAEALRTPDGSPVRHGLRARFRPPVPPVPLGAPGPPGAPGAPGAPGGANPTTPLGPRRVVACGHEIQTPSERFHVRYVSLGDQATRVGVSFRPGPASGLGPRRGLPRASGPPGRPPQPTLTDDRGTSVQSHFVGGGADEWRGYFQAVAPLNREAAWIELDGARIELVDVCSPAEVSVERLPDDHSPAARHLWRLVAAGRRQMPGGQSAEPAIEALIACGALAADDPVIGETQAVREAIGHRPLGTGPGAPRLPDPWHSLLSRAGLADGPCGTLTLSAVTPPFDGVSVAVTTLESTAEEWTITVEVAPDVITSLPFIPLARDRGLSWWARDDRGNHYLGTGASWSGGGDLGSGEISFWPALDPAATELALMPTAETERAVIRLPLTWSAP
ncbi:MAG TPA: hypothetical protein VG165_00225 [Solirubrobacteraceae bacterium]|jgi:hypothetical protein|nr:hypothetical protein [Solirubrobacteraceae bacterium]